mgnify:CR=1 FL=1
MRTVDKLDKIGPEKVKALLLEQGVSEQAAGEILDFIAITGDNAAVLAALEAIVAGTRSSTRDWRSWPPW